jgi:enoyl-CoA hydratase/carnithine racemase
MMLTGRRVDAITAHQWGLVNETVEAADLEAALDAVVGDLCRTSPSSGAAYKRATNSQIPHMSVAVISESAQSADGHEGLQAFVNKRAPRWR